MPQAFNANAACVSSICGAIATTPAAKLPLPQVCCCNSDCARAICCWARLTATLATTGGVDGNQETLLGVELAAAGELSLAAVLVAAAACTRAECPVDDDGAAVAVAVSIASVSTTAALGALLAAAGDALRELVFPPDAVATLLRAEWATAFFAVVESLALEDAELLSELADDVLPAPDPAPVSA